MAGNEENATLLAALNQSIKALNDLATALAGLVLQTTVNNSCTPTISPVINVTCGGVGTGSQFVSAPGTEGGTPPEGFTTPDPATENRKCKAANSVWSALYDVLDRLNTVAAPQTIGLGATISSVVVGAAVGLALPPFGSILGAALGLVAGIVGYLVSTNIDLGLMKDALTNYQSDLVCALYLATDADGARTAFLAVLTGPEAINSTEAALMSLLLNNNLLNLLFFSSTTEVETAIDGATLNVVCSSACGQTGDWEILQGTGMIVYGENFEVMAAQDPGNHYWYVELKATCSVWPRNDTFTVIDDPRVHPAGASLTAFDNLGGPCAFKTSPQWNENGTIPTPKTDVGAYFSCVDTVASYTLTVRIDIAE